MPDPYQVIITPRTNSDLEEIYNYIAKDSPQNARNFVAELVEAINSLQTLPHRYRIHQGRRRSKKSVRRMPIRLYLVYYRVDDARRLVEIITIRHGIRRQPRNIDRS